MGNEMSSRRTCPTVYVVLIPGGIVKAGFSRVKRWRNFVTRGAEIFALCEFPDTGAGVRSAFELEAEVDRILASSLQPAYSSAADAIPALGKGGGGWKECYRLDGPNGHANGNAIGLAIEELMARYGTLQNGTGRFQDTAENRPVPDAAGAVDNPKFDRFVELDARGLTTGRIAEELGVTVRTITRWRGVSGRLHRPAMVRRSDDVRAQALQLIREGASFTEAAATVGVTAPTVRRWFPDEPAWTRSQAGQFAVLARRMKNLGVAA